MSDLSLEFADRRSCIVGPNGIGKTTLLFVLAGLIKPASGEVRWRQRPVPKPWEITAIAADAISIPSFLTIKKLLLLTQAMWRTEWPHSLLSEFALEPHLNKKITQLSAGNLKKAQLVNAFMRNPNVLLLDEPNIALDENSCEVLLQAIKDYPGIVVAASNDPERFVNAGFCLQELSSD